MVLPPGFEGSGPRQVRGFRVGVGKKGGVGGSLLPLDLLFLEDGVPGQPPKGSKGGTPTKADSRAQKEETIRLPSKDFEFLVRIPTGIHLGPAVVLPVRGPAGPDCILEGDRPRSIVAAAVVVLGSGDPFVPFGRDDGRRMVGAHA